MRLRQTLFGAFCKPDRALRAFSCSTPSPAVYSPVTNVPLYAFRRFRFLHIYQSKYFNLSAVDELSIYNQSLVLKRHTSSNYCSTKEHRRITMAEPRDTVSDDGLCVEDRKMEEQLHYDSSTVGQTAMSSSCCSEQEQFMQVTECTDQVGEKETGAACLDLEPQVFADHDKDQSPLTLNQGPDEPVKSSERLSKRAQRKLLRKEKFKQQRKAKRAANFTSNSSPGFDRDLFTQSDYYFENGLRKVYPYHFTFSTYAKERWYGRTLLDIFEREFRVDSPDNFRTQLAKGVMRVNGKMAKADRIIKNGDLIEHDIHRHENPVSGIPIEILEDTEEVVVINKPASIPCHPCGKFRFNSIVFIMGKELGYANLRNIYRLDRLTSGVLIMGKTARKTKQLENHILHRRVHKEYIARVVGEFPPEEVTVDKPLDCLSHKLTFWRVVEKGGKPSRTTFQRLSYNGQTSLVKCIPHTGRTHQIRVHLQYLGHPIVNDPYYNSPAWGPQRGKGGNCDVSLEELCQRIMKDHNVGMWCEGENPLFQERLAKGQTSHSEEDRTPVKEDVCDGADLPQVTGSDKGSRQDGGQLADEESPAAKKPRLGSSLITPSSSGETVTADDSHPTALPLPTTLQSPSSPVAGAPCSPPSQTPVSESSVVPATVNPASVNSTSEPGVNAAPDDNLLPDTGAACVSETCVNPAHVSEAPVQGKNGSGPATGQQEETGAAEKRGRTVERKGFDPGRWKPDPHCESCRLKYIDPRPSDLLIYLHALRYKGPEWDYSTKLPDWAADDWQEPEEYSKYLQ